MLIAIRVALFFEVNLQTQLKYNFAVISSKKYDTRFNQNGSITDCAIFDFRRYTDLNYKHEHYCERAKTTKKNNENLATAIHIALFRLLLAA